MSELFDPQKLVTIAENQQKVFDAGYKKGKEEGGGTAEKTPNPFEYALYAGDIFDSQTFPTDYDLELEFQGEPTLSYILRNTKGIRSATFNYINGFSGGGVICASAFQNSQIQIINFPSGIKIYNCLNTFYGASRLHTITGEIDLSPCTTISNAFAMNTALVEVRFKPETIKASINFSGAGRLSAESIQSIIDGLAVVTDNPTLKFTSTITGNLTSTQLETIRGKGWVI